jgi:signal transduction histidine kinase
MPGTIRTHESARAHPRRAGLRAAVPVAWGLAAVGSAHAAGATGAPALGSAIQAFAVSANLPSHEIAAIMAALCAIAFAAIVTTQLLRIRGRLAEASARAGEELVAANAKAERLNMLLRAERRILVVWEPAADEPDIIGEPAPITRREAGHDLLAFGTWLDPANARMLENAVEELRSRGQRFAIAVKTRYGRLAEVEGIVEGGRAILRLRDVSGIERERADLSIRLQRETDEADALRMLVEALPTPMWARGETGKVVFANAAYAGAVEVKDGGEVVRRGVELFDRAARAELLSAHEGAMPFQGRLPAIVAGTRRMFNVMSYPARRGSAGIAIDASEADALRTEMGRMAQAQRRILDQLSTGVAIFGADQRLSFYNLAYRSLWDLDAGFLDQNPTDSAVLDQLRSSRKLPEEQDFRQWKARLHEAYRALDTREYDWHLPDGRTLRVVTTPNPEGGVIYLFHDNTRRLDLERRYDALIKVQGETLENLSEAVAVFASDGRLRLFNPAFARMWKLDPAALASRPHPHIEAVIGWCHALVGDAPFWRALRTAVTAIDGREPVTGRIERRDGGVIDCATVPLPDGATLVTFQDVTDSANVERALRERNEALEQADRIKIDFVHHVSYELRSPLTNIIGFSHFLNDPSTGPLTDRQREYLGYIRSSTDALLAIINNILDLASIDAGAMTLSLGPVDILGTMRAAAEGVQDRLVQSGISLDIRAAPAIGSFIADQLRVRQSLFNLLANAVSFSPRGETVTLAAECRNDTVIFSVTDRGPGIPAEVQDKVFDWFETHSLGSRHRGTGLGLSLVRSFVELHGGTVTLDSAVGRGTTVTCIFPAGEAAERSAA